CAAIVADIAVNIFGEHPPGSVQPDFSLVGSALGAAIIWLILSSRQREQIRVTQRIAAALAGALTLILAIVLAAHPAANSAIESSAGMLSLDLMIGALLIGAVTDSMLLGHRYLTDMGMTIAPLRRLTRLMIIALAVRAIFLLTLYGPKLQSLASARTRDAWPIVLLSVRFGVVFLTGLFAYMAWDCVKRRSTQSAT